MHRTEGANYGTDLNGNNVFKETPLPPSTVGADFLNAVQEEICNAITASGQEIKTAAEDTTHDQLAIAIARAQNVYDQVIMSQETFNSIWERTGANAYKVKDSITSLLIKPLTGGYFLTGATSPLSGGDTWGVFTLNNVMNMVCENESLIVFGNDNGKMVFPAVNGSFTNVILWRPTGGGTLVQVTGTGSSFLPLREFYGNPVTTKYSRISISGGIGALGRDSIQIGQGSSAGSENAIAIGSGAFTNTTSSTVIGDGAVASNGNYATAVGFQASGQGINGNAFGSNASNTSTGTGGTALGYGAANTEANVIKLGNASTTVKTQSAVVVISDRRDKSDITDNDAGLEAIKKIKTKKFKMNPREAYFIRDEKGKLVKDKDGKIQYDEAAHKAKTKAGKRWHRGVIAQEIAETFDSTDFAIIKDSLVNSPDSFDQMGVDYQEFIAILIKSVQELAAKVEALETETKKLRGNK